MQLSGNKVRKLEFLLAEAMDRDADCVITIGGVQSNHCRATAVAASGDAPPRWSAPKSFSRWPAAASRCSAVSGSLPTLTSASAASTPSERTSTSSMLRVTAPLRDSGSSSRSRPACAQTGSKGSSILFSSDVLSQRSSKTTVPPSDTLRFSALKFRSQRPQSRRTNFSRR